MKLVHTMNEKSNIIEVFLLRPSREFSIQKIFTFFIHSHLLQSTEVENKEPFCVCVCVVYLKGGEIAFCQK